MRLCRLTENTQKAARRFAPRRCVEAEVLEEIAQGHTQPLEDDQHFTVALHVNGGVLTAFCEEVEPGVFVVFLLRRDRTPQEVAA